MVHDGCLNVETVGIQTETGNHIPTPEETTNEARALCMKLILFPESFTLFELARLQEIFIAEGYMD